MYLATRHATYSAALSTEATATFMFRLDLAKGILEAKWEINCHNDLYPSALCTEEETPGLSKVRKLPSDHLHQTPQGPQDINSTLDPPQSSEATQHSSSPNHPQSARLARLDLH